METSLVPPKAPPKTEVIPIHASDRGSFKRCRRRWNWSSPMRQNLVPTAETHGVYMPLWFGGGIHWALRHYYDPLLQRDPVEVFRTWWDVQWNGGEISEDWLEISFDRKPKLVSDQLYRVQGLSTILPDPDVEEFDRHFELGVGMLEFYKEYAAEHDDFTVIAAEHTFSVPIYDSSGNILTWVDPRDGEEKEVHLRGTQDAIIQDNDSGKYGLMEHKSAIDIGESYFLKLEKDEQCTTYMLAAQREAEIHDLPYKKLDFVLYNAIRKAYPKPPTILKDGISFSINRQQESPSYKMLCDYIDTVQMWDQVEADDKLKNYVEYVKEQGDEQFVKRDFVYRNRAEIRSCSKRVYMEALDMLDNPRIYPNPTGAWDCLRCPFRAPCIAADDGSDWKVMLEDEFEPNWTR